MGSIVFQGHASGDYDRVKFPLENRNLNVGGDFTVEFWFRCVASDNPAGTANPNATDGTGWITGHIMVDRDIDDGVGENERGDWGISMAQGRIAFGVAKGPDGKTIWNGSGPDLRDGQWHHVAAVREATGAMRLYIDGVLNASGMGPAGDVSYLSGRPTQRPNSDPYLVLAAEKHDYPGYLGYKGHFTGLRISRCARYRENFTPGIHTVGLDPLVVALYTFSTAPDSQVVDLSGNGNHGVMKVGGTPPSPTLSSEAPF